MPFKASTENRYLQLLFKWTPSPPFGVLEDCFLPWIWMHHVPLKPRNSYNSPHRTTLHVSMSVLTLL